MEHKKLENGMKLPVIGLGTWGIGGLREADYSGDSNSIDVFRKAIGMGYKLIDTAELYGNGHTEELIGEAIKGFERSEITIIDKVFKTNLKYHDLIDSCMKSLQRLKTNYIDIYLIHAPNPEIPIEETMEAMDHLVDEGIVRHIGVSNFSVEQMKEAQKHSRNRIIANEIPYNLAMRNDDDRGVCSEMESEIIPYCQKNGMFAIAYKPLARGLLARPGPIMNRLSKKYGKTRAQIALNWLISKKNVVAIPKASKPEHLKENLGAIDWSMDKEDILILDKGNFGQ